MMVVFRDRARARSGRAFPFPLVLSIILVVHSSTQLANAVPACSLPSAAMQDIDLPGGDGTTLTGVASFDACSAACGTNAACTRFTYSQTAQLCFMKGNNAGAPTYYQPTTTYGNVVSAFKITNGAACSLPRSAMQDIDLPGGDVTSLTGVASFGACTAACAANDACTRYTYSLTAQTCFIKGNNAGQPTHYTPTPTFGNIVSAYRSNVVPLSYVSSSELGSINWDGGWSVGNSDSGGSLLLTFTAASTHDVIIGLTDSPQNLPIGNYWYIILGGWTDQPTPKSVIMQTSQGQTIAQATGQPCSSTGQLFWLILNNNMLSIGTGAPNTNYIFNQVALPAGYSANAARRVGLSSFTVPVTYTDISVTKYDLTSLGQSQHFDMWYSVSSASDNHNQDVDSVLVTFMAAGQNDVTVALSTDQNVGAQPNGWMIVLGANGNSQNVITKTGQSGNVALASGSSCRTTGQLFWLTLRGNLLSVGTGTPGTNLIFDRVPLTLDAGMTPTVAAFKVGFSSWNVPITYSDVQVNAFRSTCPALGVMLLRVDQLGNQYVVCSRMGAAGLTPLQSFSVLRYPRDGSPAVSIPALSGQACFYPYDLIVDNAANIYMACNPAFVKPYARANTLLKYAQSTGLVSLLSAVPAIGGNCNTDVTSLQLDSHQNLYAACLNNLMKYPADGSTPSNLVSTQGGDSCVGSGNGFNGITTLKVDGGNNVYALCGGSGTSGKAVIYPSSGAAAQSFTAQFSVLGALKVGPAGDMYTMDQSWVSKLPLGAGPAGGVGVVPIPTSPALCTGFRLLSVYETLMPSVAYGVCDNGQIGRLSADATKPATVVVAASQRNPGMFPYTADQQYLYYVTQAAEGTGTAKIVTVDVQQDIDSFYNSYTDSFYLSNGAASSLSVMDLSLGSDYWSRDSSFWSGYAQSPHTSIPFVLYPRFSGPHLAIYNQFRVSGKSFVQPQDLDDWGMALTVQTSDANSQQVLSVLQNWNDYYQTTLSFYFDFHGFINDMILGQSLILDQVNTFYKSVANVVLLPPAVGVNGVTSLLIDLCSAIAGGALALLFGEVGIPPPMTAGFLTKGISYLINMIVNGVIGAKNAGTYTLQQNLNLQGSDMMFIALKSGLVGTLDFFGQVLQDQTKAALQNYALTRYTAYHYSMSGGIDHRLLTRAHNAWERMLMLTFFRSMFDARVSHIYSTDGAVEYEICTIVPTNNNQINWWETKFDPVRARLAQVFGSSYWLAQSPVHPFSPNPWTPNNPGFFVNDLTFAPMNGCPLARAMWHFPGNLNTEFVFNFDNNYDQTTNSFLDPAPHWRGTLFKNVVARTVSGYSPMQEDHTCDGCMACPEVAKLPAPSPSVPYCTKNNINDLKSFVNTGVFGSDQVVQQIRNWGINV